MYIVVLYKANIGCVLDGKEKVFAYSGERTVVEI